MSEQDDSVRWREVLEANPDAQVGMFNPARKKLLRPGVYIDLSPLTAASWGPGVREKLNGMGLPTHIPVAADVQEGLNKIGPVRVTIKQVGDDGKIEVEALGIREQIWSSVFYNSITGPDTGMTSGSGEPNYDGGGWAPPPPDFGGNVG